MAAENDTQMRDQLTEAELNAAILQQVEYYFGDSNLPRDNFLKEQVAADPTGEGWVEISVLLRSNRLKALTTDVAVVANALKESKELLGVHEDGTKVRRVPPAPAKSAFWDNAVFVKGLPEDSTIESVRTLFAQAVPDVTVVSVRLRRKRDTGKFKGNAHVELGTAEQRAQLLAAGKFELNDAKYPVLEAWHKKKKRKHKTDEGDDNSSPNKRAKTNGNDASAAAAAADAAEELKFDKDLIVKVDGLDQASREDVSAVMTALGAQPAFIDYRRNGPVAYVRLDTSSELKAAAVVEAVAARTGDDAVTIGNTKPTITALSGDEETEYWRGIAAKRKEYRKDFKKRGRKGRRN